MTTAVRSVGKPTKSKPNQTKQAKEITTKKKACLSPTTNTERRLLTREEICARKTALVNRLEDAQTESHPVVRIELDKHKIDRQAILDAEKQIAEIYPLLIEGIDYTPEDLLGHEYWASLNSLKKRIAIICLKYLAELGDVPMVDVAAARNGAILFQAV
jgi:hypothetical protein